jgi:hypothetical protein
MTSPAPDVVIAAERVLTSAQLPYCAGGGAGTGVPTQRA